MRACVKWLDNMTFVGETGSGHALVMDASPDVGGRDLGARPMEMLLLGMGGCSAVDVMLILKKSRQLVRDCWVEIEAQRADAVPAVFTHIHVHFVVVGDGVSEKHVERAVGLSTEKYCSASIMLGKTVDITHDFEVREG